MRVSKVRGLGGGRRFTQTRPASLPSRGEPGPESASLACAAGAAGERPDLAAPVFSRISSLSSPAGRRGLLLPSAALLGLLLCHGFASAAGPSGASQPVKRAEAADRTPTQVTEADEFALPDAGAAPASRLTPENERRAKAVEAFMAALYYEQAGDTAAALESYRTTLDLSPGETSLALKVARAYLRQGSPASALDVLKNAEAARPGDHRILLAISDIYWRVLKKRDLAVEYAERAQRANPDNPEAFAALHGLYLADRSPSKAAALLDAAERGKSKNPYLWFQLARTAARPPGSASAGAGSAAALSAEAAARALRLARKGLGLAGKDSAALIAGGDILAALGSAGEAAAAYAQAAEHAPGDAAPRERLARILLGLGREKEAVAPLEELARIDPSRAGVFELLGDIHQKNGEMEKAAAAFEKSLALTPADPLSYIKAARVMRELGRHDRAAQILDSSLKALPDVPEVQLELAITLSLAGRHVEALSVARSVIEAAREGRGSLDAQAANYLAGGIAYKAGEHDEAARYYKAAIEADPANAAGPYNDLGYMWLELDKNIDEAGELIRRAVEIEPDNGAFLDSLGWYYYKKGEYQEALSYLLKAEAAAPSGSAAERAEFLAVIHDHIGDVHFALGNTAEALHYWQLAAQSDPSNAAVAEKIEREKKRLTSNTPAQPPAPGASQTPAGPQ